MRHAPLLALIAVLAAAAPAAAATHGDVVSVKKTKPVATLKGAAKDLTVTYLTKGVGGKLVPVTGTVAFPKGAAPKGGWPVLNWAHGSTGIADTCAPSIRGKRELVHPMLLKLLKAGFVVVRTDYEGLGTRASTRSSLAPRKAAPYSTSRVRRASWTQTSGVA